MTYIVSRYNHEYKWLDNYASEVVMYDRSPEPLEWAIKVPNIGSDWYDKFTFIIDNYDNLPDVAVYTKCNLFKYVTANEFAEMKNNTTFTPILTKWHTEKPGVSYYKDGIYWEINNLWFIGAHPVKYNPYQLMELLGTKDLPFVPFAPGSNYIVPKENILKKPKSFYETLRSCLDWSVYPGEAMIIERGMYTVWK